MDNEDLLILGVVGIVGIIIGVFIGYAALEKNVTNIYSSSEVYFTSTDKCESIIISWIGKTNSSIYLMMYSFTSDRLANKTIEAYERGVKVYIVLEPRQVTQYSKHRELTEAGIDVIICDHSGVMGHRAAVLDSRVVLTGSYSWSKAAPGNNENLLVLIDPSIAERFIAEYKRLVK